MPITQRTFVRAVTTLKLGGLAVLLVIVGMTFWLAVLAREHAGEVARGRLTRFALIEARNLLQDMETGQRGYLLTGRASYLEPYERAAAGLEAQVRSLVDMDAFPPAQLRELKTVLDEKTAELAETVSLMKRGAKDKAMSVVDSDRGKEAMDNARSIFSRLLSTVDERIESKLQAQDSAIFALQWAVATGAVLIILVVGGSTLISYRYTRELVAARNEIDALNASLERRVEQRTQELARANEEIQRFAYVVSHDLRSPLVNVIGFTRELEELGEEIFDPARAAGPARDLQTEFREATGFISASVAKMDGLINAILRIARENGRELRPEPIDLGSISQAAADSVQHRVGERGGEIVVEPGMPRVVSDRMAVEQIVSNLVDNAVKYAHPERPPRIVISGRAERDHVTLTVADNGRGIAASDHEKVFGLFSRVGALAEAGEGIGLSHVRALARRLGGDVTLASDIGAGSRFTVRLPKLT